MPGLRAIPAVTMQTSAPSISSYLFVPTTSPSKPSIGPACDRIAAAVRDYPNGFWQRALVFCQIRAGKKEQARLGLALFKETGAGKDRAFPYLAAILLGDKPKDTVSPVSVGALEIAMLHRTGPSLPESFAKSDDPAVLSAVATAPDSEVAVRLAAAERAEAAGDRDALERIRRRIELVSGNAERPR